MANFEINDKLLKTAVSTDEILIQETAGGTVKKVLAGDFIGGAIGGSDTQIQFNNSGSFGGSASLVWDDTNKLFTVKGLNATGSSVLNIEDNATNVLHSFKSNGDINTSSEKLFWDESAGLLTIKDSGAGTNLRLEKSTASPLYLDFYQNSVNTVRLGAETSNELLIYTNGTERVRVKTQGLLMPSGHYYDTVNGSHIRLYNQTTPPSFSTDAIKLMSADVSAGNTTLSIITEGSPVGTGTPTQNRTVGLSINGTVYYLLASTTAT